MLRKHRISSFFISLLCIGFLAGSFLQQDIWAASHTFAPFSVQDSPSVQLSSSVAGSHRGETFEGTKSLVAPLDDIASPATPTPTPRKVASETQEPDENSPSPRPSRPVRLRIPAIGVDAAIEAVGEDDTGRMDVPSHVDNVAWYELGVAPGEIGNAVIAGHLDRIGGAPAVFWSLGKLQPGDEILVTDTNGVEYRFQVTQVVSYPYESAPLDEIFGFSLRSRLNLITCRGRWNRQQGTYEERLVVYSEQVLAERRDKGYRPAPEALWRVLGRRVLITLQ